MQSPPREFSNRRLGEIYNEYNVRWFGGDLPKIPVRWGDPRKFSRREGKATLAVTNFDGKRAVEIVFAPRLRKNREWQLIRFTLLHECCHVVLPHNVADHGRAFNNKMRELANAGAFDGLW